MDGWKIRRAVDLQEDSPPVERLRALATLSSRQAHDFVIVVLDGGKPADLTGMQPWLSMILPGRASLQKQVGSVQANVVSVTLPKTGYAERGDVSIILSLMDEDGQTQIPLYGCVIRVMEDSTDTIIDEEKVMLNIFGLLVMSGKDEDMMAMIWAQQIMLGKKTYKQVPRLLKDKVKEVLIDSGCEDLVTE